ncbi:MAG: Maf family protein [Xanthobacteraceae bacterium]
MALWLEPQALVLASQSTARRALLEAAGIPIEVRPAKLDERAIEECSRDVGSGDLAVLLAREKAVAVAASMVGRIVLGADQILGLGAERFSKPFDRSAARDQLRALRGRTHSLYSGMAVLRGADVLFEHVAVATLTMRPFTDRFLESYLDAMGDAATASVGAYQVEGLGVHLFERIDGDHSVILGLPLLPLLAFMRREGFLAQ